MKTDLAKKVTLSILMGSMLFANTYALAADVAGQNKEISSDFTGNIYAGQTEDGDALNNTLNITGGTIDSEIIAGGSVVNEEFVGTGNANENKVTINGESSSLDLTTDLIFGGVADSGTANENKVTINDVTIYGKTPAGSEQPDGVDIYGGMATAGSASGNELTITNVTIDRSGGDDSEDIIAAGANGFDQTDAGAGGPVGAVENNTLTINGTLTGTNLSIYGGYIDYADGNANNNSVIIGTAGGDKTVVTSTFKGSENVGNYIIGGYSEGSGAATGNNVTITNADLTIREVIGGWSQSGKVTGNKVSITDTTFNDIDYFPINVYGGYTEGKSAAENNEVYIKLNDGSAIDQAYAAITSGGDATNNKITFENGKINYIGGAATDKHGGTGGSAIGNGVIMTGGEAQEVAGGEAFDKGAVVNNNYVKMSGGTAQNVYGANTLYATASGNTVTISGNAKVTGSGENGYQDEDESITKHNGVYGAYGAADADSEEELAALTNNTVTITGGQVASAFGAFSEGNGDVSYNKVNVTGGTTGVGAEGNDRNELAGGYSVKGDVIGNAVEITAGEVNNEQIYGGRTTDGKANENSVSVSNVTVTTSYIAGGESETGETNNNSVNIDNVTLNAYDSNDTVDIYGALNTKGAVSGNTLNINNLTIKRTEVSGDGKVEDIIAAGANGFDYEDEVEDRVVGEVSNNTLKITGNLEGTNLYIYGGYVDYADGDTVNNRVEIGSVDGETTITNNEVGANNASVIYGGYSEGAGNSTNNSVTVINATLNIDDVKGGYAETGIADGNSVIISDSDANVEQITGGYSDSSSATNNIVSIKNSTTSAQNIYGGHSYEGAVSGNTVELSDVELASERTKVYGGYSDSGDVTDNNVVISGKVAGQNDGEVDIYAGYSATGKAESNKITLLSGANVENANLIGGSNQEESSTNTNNNELVIGEGVGNNSWSGTVNSISNFSRIAFANVKWEDGGTVLTIADTTKSNLEGTVVDADGVNFDATSDVNVGESMTFLAAAKPEESIEGVKYEFGKYTVGTMYEGTMDGSSETGVATVQTQQVATQNNLLAENRAVAAAFVNQGTDLISDSLDVLSRDGNYGVKTFAAVYGNRSKYDVNSDLKINGWSVIAGVGSEKALKNGDFSWGVFYENGSGNYRTYNEFNNEFFRGDGSVVYNGGGIAARYEQNNGVYTEASLRAGMLKSEMDNAVKDGAGNTYGYDSDTTYYGAHLGIGKIISLNESSDLDIYGKFFHTYNDGDTVTIGNGNKYEFDSITSDRLRLGARITTNKENKFSTYYGLAYEYEFNGDADMRVGKLNAETQSLQGSSYMAEIGMNYQPSPDSPWSFDLNMRGYTGERQGESFNVQATYTF